MSFGAELDSAVQPHSNYALVPYEPGAISSDSLTMAAVLAKSFEIAGVAGPAGAACAAIRETVGLGNAAFGVKWEQGRFSWEVYFYVYGSVKSATLSGLRSVLEDAGLKTSSTLEGDDRSWYSVSADLDSDHWLGVAEVDGYHLYVTHHPAEPRLAVSYRASPGGVRLENLYRLFDPRRERDAAEGHLGASVMAGAEGVSPEQVLWPELMGGDHMALTHKPNRDGVYFGGVDADAFGWFLDRLDYPLALCNWFRQEQERLAHLRFDVGFDYGNSGSWIKVLKSGFYGSI